MWNWTDSLIYLPVAEMSVSLGKLLALSIVCGILAALSGGIGFAAVLLPSLLFMNIPYGAVANTVNLCVMALFSRYVTSPKVYAKVNWRMLFLCIPWILLGVSAGAVLHITMFQFFYFQAAVKIVNVFLLGYMAVFMIEYGIRFESQKYSIIKYRPKGLMVLSVGKGKRMHIFSVILLGFLPVFLNMAVGGGVPIIVRSMFYEIYSNKESDFADTSGVMIFIIAACSFTVNTTVVHAPIDLVLSLSIVMIFIISNCLLAVVTDGINRYVSHLVIGIVMIIFLLLFVASLVANPLNPYYVVIS